MKKEVFEKHIAERYKGIDNILNDDNFTDEDVKWFLRFQDADKLYKGFENWLKYRQLIDKIKRVGVNGVLMREDVKGSHRAVEDLGNGKFEKYLVVETNYGDVWVCSDGRTVRYK